MNPWEERSKTKQDLFNKQINSEAANFHKDILVPRLKMEIKEKLGEGEWFSVDSEDEMVINFYYPQIFEAEYLKSCVRLEIGSLARWLPSHNTIIVPFAAEKYPELFIEKETSVLRVMLSGLFGKSLQYYIKLQTFQREKYCLLDMQDIYMMCIVSEIHG